MKKIVIYSLSFMIVAGAAISCRKTSKGKMSNEWELDSYSSVETQTNDDGDKEITRVTIQPNTITVVEEVSPNGGATTKTTQSGVLNEFAYTIEKDGTWSQTLDVTFTYNGTMGGYDYSTVETRRTVTSGTWNFLGNVDEFKKNERVVFNTIDELEKWENTTTSDSPFGPNTTTTSGNDKESFADGEKSEIMLVVESKRKELQLKTEQDYSYQKTQSGITETTTVSGFTELSLIQGE